jgi:NAD(P)-dependent dehydrogenase (short-subunit alcohol dehydrogenase family)
MTHPVLTAGRVAVVTGAASGIGLAAVKRFAALGMKICMVDSDEARLKTAGQEVVDIAANGIGDVLAVTLNVAEPDSIAALKRIVYQRFDEVGLLMNNAVTRVGGSTLDNFAHWQQAMNVNLWGVISGVQTFVPAMLEQKTPAMVINTGSKQGITNPPGNAAYNVTKAALKSYTESLQHELRNIDSCRVTAHLLVPGWTTTGKREHQPGAWLPDQVIDVMLAALQRGDFYIVCPDDEVTPEMDNRRILWAAGDIVENRPALSRWHPDYVAAFDQFKQR